MKRAWRRSRLFKIIFPPLPPLSSSSRILHPFQKFYAGPLGWSFLSFSSVAISTSIVTTSIPKSSMQDPCNYSRCTSGKFPLTIRFPCHPLCGASPHISSSFSPPIHYRIHADASATDASLVSCLPLSLKSHRLMRVTSDRSAFLFSHFLSFLRSQEQSLKHWVSICIWENSLALSYFASNAFRSVNVVATPRGTVTGNHS